MANTTTSPNMNLPVPTVSQDPGPDWANNINSCLLSIDSHNHSTGQGVPITPSGIAITSDLSFGNNNAASLRSVRFSAQGSPLALPADLGCVYVSGVDLYYNDESGNQVRITQGGSVTGSTGTITGLPSGTASASYSAGTFTFQSATNTPATMAVGPLVIGRVAAASKTVTLSPNAAQAADYALTLPAALPASTSYATIDNTGAISYTAAGILPLGAVIATFPNLSGAYSCSATTVADANGFVKCNGQTISDGTSPMNGAVIPNINNDVFLAGSTTAGSTGGNNSSAHTHDVTSNVTVATQPTFTVNAHTHVISHVHMWTRYQSGAPGQWLTTFADDASLTNFVGATPYMDAETYQSGASAGVKKTSGYGTNNFYTTGVLDAQSGTDGIGAASATANTNATTRTANVALTNNTVTTGPASATDNRPSFISTLYVMRVK